MLRKGVRGLVPLATGQAACFTSSAAALGAPAIADAKTTGGGFLAKLLGGGGSSRLSVPLTDALAVEGPAPVPPPGTRPTTEMTTLPNGVRVASEATLVRAALASVAAAATSDSALGRCKWGCFGGRWAQP